jgi:putative membrane protein
VRICTSTATLPKTRPTSAVGDRLGPLDGEATIERILIRVAINALALWAAAGIIDGISLQDGFWKVLLVAAIFGLVNAVLKPLLVILSIPFIVVTLGIALIVINALMLLITDYFTASLTVDDFGSALLGAIVISVVSWTAGRLLPDPRTRPAQRG